MMKHFIFDLDGTLIDSVPDIHYNINLLLSEENIDQLTLEETTSFVGNGSRKLVERAFHHFNTAPETEAQLTSLTDRFIDHYMDNLTTNTIIYPHVKETLTQLKQAGHRLTICTNKPIKPTLAILEDLGLANFFETVTGGDSYKERKPHPLPLEKNIQSIGLPKKACLMVGDSIYDMQAGKAAEIDTILLTYGYTHGNIDEIETSYAFDSFKDIEQLI